MHMLRFTPRIPLQKTFQQPMLIPTILPASLTAAIIGPEGILSRSDEMEASIIDARVRVFQSARREQTLQR